MDKIEIKYYRRLLNSGKVPTIEEYRWGLVKFEIEQNNKIVQFKAL